MRGGIAGVLATTLFGVAIPAYAYITNPAWMWGYALDPATIHPWVVVWIFVIYYLCFFAGFSMVPKKGGWWLLAGVGVLNLVLLALVWPRYSKVGTYEEFHNGTAANLMDSPLSTTLNIAFGVTVVGTALLYFWAIRKKDSQKEG